MKRSLCVRLFLVLWLEASCLGAVQSQIWYSADDLGGGRCQYEYEVVNIGLTSPIEQFTIWFAYGAYENLLIETPDPQAGDWDEIVLQPEPLLTDDGAYDAKALGPGIGMGQSVSGFAVSFDWLGDALMPGPQFYEIIHPDTFQAIDSGMTKLIPEPGTLLLLALGGLALLRKPATP